LARTTPFGRTRSPRRAPSPKTRSRERVAGRAELHGLRGLRQLGVERADDRARRVAAERVAVDVVRERRADVVVDQDGRVLDGVLDQLLRVHDHGGGLDDVERDLRVLGAGRLLRCAFRDGRDGRPADVLGQLLALARDLANAQTGHRRDRRLTVETAAEDDAAFAVGDEESARGVGASSSGIALAMRAS
jgi:hypothetical protein